MICGGFGSLFRNLVLQPRHQELMLDLNGGWDLQSSSKPHCAQHRLTAAAAPGRPITKGTKAGGTSRAHIGS
jgi:hypothetical protein